MSAVSAALGPSLCGVLISGFNLQAIFLVNVSLGALTFLLASRTLPGDRKAARTDGADFDGMGTPLLD
jgi:MFS family permease